MSTHFDDLEAFFADSPDRRHATEVDLGNRWRETPDGKDHRVSWIESGELYAVVLEHSGPQDPQDRVAGSVELLGSVAQAPEDAAESCAFDAGDGLSLPKLRELI